MSANGEALKREAEALDQEVVTAAIPPAPDVSVSPGETTGAESSHEPPAPAVVTPEQEAAAMIEIVLSLVEPVYPMLKIVYTPEARERLARAAGPLMKKYNFSLSGLEKWKEEIDFALVALPLAIKTIEAIKISNAIRQVRPETAAPPTPASSPAKSEAAPAPDAVVFP